MKSKSLLAKNERENIFSLFARYDKLKFNEIEKELKMRSNMVSYHLEQMQKQGLLEKKGFYYVLTKKGEKYLPMIKHLTGESLCPLPIVLAAVVKNRKILLMKRSIRPYKGYWGLIGGKMLLEESFPDCSIRLVLEKTGLKTSFGSINAILHERVSLEDSYKNSFILFLTTLKPKTNNLRESSYGELKWFNLSELNKTENKKQIIPSDYWLIKNKLNSKIDVKTAVMDEKDELLHNFKFV